MTNRWAILALLFFARISLPLQFQSLPPISTLLMEDLALNLAQFGLLMGLFLFPGVVIALPGGLLGARFGDQVVVRAGFVLLSLGGLLFSVSDSFWMAGVARVVGGVGLVLVNVQLTKITTDRFAGRELSTAMGILMSAWPLGSAIAFSSLGYVATVSSWRVAAGLTAGYAALWLALSGLPYGRPVFTAATAGGASRRIWAITGRELGLVLLAGVCWSFFNAGVAVYLSFTPTFLVASGMALASAAVLVGLVSWIGLGSVPLAGWLADRTGRINLFITAGSLCSALFIAGLVTAGGSAVVWIVLLGVVYGALPGTIMSLPGQVLSPEGRSTGLGVYYTVYSAGVTVFPPIAGWLGDLTGSAAAPVLFAGVLMAAIVPTLAAFRLLQRRWEPAARPALDVAD